jgi:hypothetical protein
VDGSFVEEEQNPHDVDVVTFVDHDWLNGAPSDIERFWKDVLNGRSATKAKYSTHAFSFPACPEGHWYYPVFEKRRRYWRKWLGHTRAEHGKGFISMLLGDVTRAPHVSTEGSKG